MYIDQPEATHQMVQPQETKYHAGLRNKACAIAPLSIASEARDLPRAAEAPDPSEVPLPRFVTMLLEDFLRMITEARPVCGFHKPGYLRKGSSEVLILEEMD